MAERLFGIETEYALSCTNRLYLGAEPADYVRTFMRYAAAWPHLYGGAGLFFGNGSRLYIDTGYHPEMCTPECADPWEVVRYILAGERMLVTIARRCAGDHSSFGSVSLFKSNVDYSGSGSTWGCHESYMYRGNILTLHEEIIPHLVSRIVYTGAGGFDSHSPGIAFTVSPRVHHLTEHVSGDSTGSRPIFHTRDEPLMREGYRRVHLICGESLSSQTAMWLKVATTALVVAMAEAGIRLGNGVELFDPLGAMTAFACDAECQATALLKNGKSLSAIQIQRHYLNRAEAHMHDSFMPPWAEEACRHWRRVLDQLETEPQAMAGTLDWLIKRAVYAEFARSRGIDWKLLPAWNYVLKWLQRGLMAANDGLTLSADSILDRQSPTGKLARGLERYLEEKGLKWEDLEKVLRLRQQLFEIDTKFSQLGEQGIFTNLEGRGVLSHHFEGIGEIDRAMKDPPAKGRARLRGKLIQQLTVDVNRYSCDWHAIWDRDSQRLIDLSDPFATDEDWKSNQVYGGMQSERGECFHVAYE